MTEFSAIAKQQFTLVSVTPIAIHGADEKRGEYRLSTLNGMMRYWFEALNTRSEKKVDAIFGSAANKQSMKSHVWLMDELKPGRHLPQTKYKPSSTRNFQISGVNEETTWPIIVATKNSQKNNLIEGEMAVKSAVLFGGFGQRGRHGIGSFKITELNIQNLDDVTLQIQELALFYGCKVQKQTEYDLTCIKNQTVKKGKVSWLNTYTIPTSIKNVSVILSIIRQVTHDNHLKFRSVLGSIAPKFASPLHTSIYQMADGSYVILVSEVSHKASNPKKYQESKKFYLTALKKELMKGGKK